MAQAALAEPDDTVIHWEPQPKQAAFISCPADDVGFGGARGGGKSEAVAGDFINHEERYGEHAIAMAFRRERTQIVELIERSKQILVPLGFKWHEADKYFRGPRGGRLRFTYLENDSDADAYQGHSYTRIYPEEMGTFPNEGPINKLQATLRSGHGVPCQMKGTCNPGGPGHQWVKARYGLGGRIDQIIEREFEFVNPFTKEKIQKRRVFIPSRVTDNKYLGTDYIGNLYQVGSKALVDAWIFGDWDIVEGAFFDCWDTAKHVIRPFEIPQDWMRYRSADWGFAKPFSVGWWAVVGDDFDLGQFSHGEGSIRLAVDHSGLGDSQRGFERLGGAVPIGSQILPRGAIIRYREWYGKTAPNTGLRLTAEEVADGILERSPKDEKITYGVLDPAAFSQDGGPSIAERMSVRKLHFSKADNKRVTQKGAMGGWDQMRARLVGEDGRPMIYTFSTCVDSIRTIPALQHDPDKPEDLDSDGEDHAADEWRYACMARPWIPRQAKPEEPKYLFQAVTDNSGVTKSNLTMHEIIKRLERQAKRR